MLINMLEHLNFNGWMWHMGDRLFKNNRQQLKEICSTWVTGDLKLFSYNQYLGNEPPEMCMVLAVTNCSLKFNLVTMYGGESGDIIIEAS